MLPSLRRKLEMLAERRDELERLLADPSTIADNERFRGAVRTYCIEAMMRDAKALQAGTSHYLGQNFAKAFEIQFQAPNGELEFAYQTSWGVSTRLVGAIVMGHGDEKGLMLPPKLAPFQVVIVPIYKTDEEKTTVMERCNKVFAELKPLVRIKMDDRDNLTPGFKYNYWDQKGAPVRINIGPKDVANNVVEIVRRDTLEKLRGVAGDSLTTEIPKLLDSIHKNMFERALKFRQDNTHKLDSYDEMKKTLDDKNGFIEAHWCGDGDCELKIKEETISRLESEAVTREEHTRTLQRSVDGYSLKIDALSDELARLERTHKV
mgnify:CR=1 FL=1